LLTLRERAAVPRSYADNIVIFGVASTVVPVNLWHRRLERILHASFNAGFALYFLVRIFTWHPSVRSREFDTQNFTMYPI
jgi:hypothetical protein